MSFSFTKIPPSHILKQNEGFRCLKVYPCHKLPFNFKKKKKKSETGSNFRHQNFIQCTAEIPNIYTSKKYLPHTPPRNTTHLYRQELSPTYTSNKYLLHILQGIPPTNTPKKYLTHNGKT